MATLATLHLPSALRAPARVSRSSGRYVPARSHHPPRADLIDSSNLARFDRAATRSRARARSPASPARCTTEQRARDVRVRAPEVLTRTFPPRPTLAAPPPFDATPRLRASRATAASSCACLRRSSTPRRRRPARTWCVPGCVTHTSPITSPHTSPLGRANRRTTRARGPSSPSSVCVRGVDVTVPAARV